MSRPPFNPAGDRPQSPFDRPAQQGSGPPPSFKTNVNRNKTRKWVEARHNNYDGDDWGGFDPYDEYGSYGESPTEPPMPQIRKNSFDRGEERRAFSAGQPFAAKPRTASQGSRDPRDIGVRREFSQQAHVPQPLHTRPGPPASQTGSKSQPGYNAPDQLPLPIPFIRPSDIYKRMEQERERERQSLDSSRPSMESSSSRKPVPPTTGLSASGGIDQKQASNENLIEPGPSVASPIGAPSAPFLKQQEAESDQSRSSEPTEIAGFQSMVDTAFDHAADNSVPATPATTTYSHRAVQDISRSNTDSTSDISPIMSRVPSSGNADSRGRAAAAAAAANLPGTNTERVSTIAEEVPADTSKGHANPQRPRSGASFGEINRPEVTSPSPQASPARSPRLETDNRRLSQALAAEISQDHNEVSHGPPHDEMAPTIQADDKRPPVDEPTTPVTEQPRPVAGDVLLRPLHFDRTASSVVSSVAPTPPAKDSPRREGFDHEKQYFEQTGETSEPQDRALTNSSLGDPDFAESDRLREAIVRSLSPNPAFVAEHQPVREQTVAPSFDSLDIHHPQTREENGPSQALLEEQAGEQTADLNNATLTDRPALLSQRFSWENRSSAFFNPSGLGAEVDLPQGDLHVINPEPASPPIESGLHDHSIIAESPELRSTNDRDLAENHLEAPVSPVETTERVNRDSSDMLSSPVVDRMAEPPNFPSAEIEGADNVLPRTSFSDPRQTSGSGPTRIPPFREILAIKNPTERISTYNSTRKQFAEMNTGLRDWLSVTMAARPEHDHLTTAGPSLIPGGNVPDSIRHRPTQSIVRLAKGLGSSSKGDGPSSPSTDNHGTSGLARKSSNNYANHSPQSSANVEKMQAIGKDFLSSAGKLGGKSVVGAKGWLAKGRQKLRESSGGGGDKVD
ncbi:hypothetical protein ANO11243_051570 [Dothideomycetidae sp. 11243]|nr:hypothetical protein ANO11243_051570 [fungal sp. No.11243]